MLASGPDTARNLGIAAGLFLLAGVFRLLDSMLPPFPSALCFLMTSFLYIGLTFAWGISFFSRTLHSGVRMQLLLGCGMAVLWLVLRAVKYRFFEDGAVTRHLWYLFSPRCSAFRGAAAGQAGGARAASGVVLAAAPRCAADRRHRPRHGQLRGRTTATAHCTSPRWPG